MNNYNPFHNNFDLYVQSFLKKFFFFTLLATPRSALYHSSLTLKVKVLVTHSCPTLCNPMDCSPVCGILQPRILEWVATFFSRGSSQSRDWTWVSCFAGRFFTIWASREALHGYYTTIKGNHLLIHQQLRRISRGLCWVKKSPPQNITCSMIPST